MRPVELVRRAEERRRRRPPRRRSARAARSARRRPTRARRRRARAAAISATGVTVPTAFDAHGNATTRVRSFSSERELVEIEPALVVDVGEPHGQVLGRARARATARRCRRGRAACRRSRRRPAHSREAARESAKLSVVMFAPNATSSGGRVRGTAPPSRARCSTSASVALRRRERPADVRVRLAQVAGDRVDHRVGHLRAARAVEERERLLQRAEARARTSRPSSGHAPRVLRRDRQGRADEAVALGLRDQVVRSSARGVELRRRSRPRSSTNA